MLESTHIASRKFIAFAIAAVAVAAICLWLLPGAPVLSLCGFAAITALVLAVYSRCAGASRAGAYILLAAALALSIGIIANVHYYTVLSGGTDQSPVLHNSDALRAWNDAMARLGIGTEAVPSTYGMYGSVVATVMAVTGPGITAALMISMAATLVSILCTGVTAWRITRQRRTAATAMACCAAVCYFLASGTLLLKDAWVFAAFAIAATAFASAHEGRPARLLIPAAISAAMLVLARPNMLPAIAIGTVLCIAPSAPSAARRRAWAYTAIIVAWCAALWLLAHAYEITPEASGVINIGQQNHWVRYDAPNQMAYYSIIGDYASLQPWQKTMLIPVSAGIQYLIPFPWNWGRDIIFGPTSAYAHIAYPGYLFGIIIVYYLWRGRRETATSLPAASSRALLLMSAWGIVCWLVPCYLFGGTISRYGLMSVPLLAPAVAVTLCNADRRRLLRRAAWCCAALALVLATCYILQNHYAP